MCFAGFPQNLIIKAFGIKIKKQAVGQGIGRHTRKEVEAMGIADLKTISDYLGEKTFMMGDEPIELDCVVFG